MEGPRLRTVFAAYKDIERMMLVEDPLDIRTGGQREGMTSWYQLELIIVVLVEF